MHGRDENWAKGVENKANETFHSCDKEHQGGVKHTYQRVISACT